MTTDFSHGWNAPNSIEEFQEQFKNDVIKLYNYMNGHLGRYRAERDAIRSQLEEANKSIDNYEEQITQLNLDLNIARATRTSTSPNSNSNINTSSTINFRSEKFPDPEKFDGTRIKLPGFITQLQMKLKVNHDRFSDETSKVIYSVSRLEGRALDQVIPIANSNPNTPFSSVQAFINYLNASFGDPDPRGTALRELLTLKQGDGDFANYYSQFLRIVSYLDYNESAKMDALAAGINKDLKEAMVYRMDKPRTLEELATTLMTVDNRIRGHKAEQRNVRNNMGQFSSPISAHPSHVPGGPTPMDLSALQARSSPRPPMEQRYTFTDGVRKTTAAEKQWRRDNNLCMYCAKPTTAAALLATQPNNAIPIHENNKIAEQDFHHARI